MQRRSVSSELRQGILRSICDLGMTYSHTAAVYALPVSTVKGVVTKSMRTGDMDDARISNGSRPKLSVDNRIFLCQEIMANPASTQKNLSESLSDRYDISVHQSTISRAFKHDQITIKALSEVPCARNSVQVLQLRKNFAEWWIGHVGINENPVFNHQFEQRLVYVDECGFNVNIHRKRGWSLKGDRACISTASNRGGNISCFATLSPSHGFWLTSRYGAFNHMTFLSELQCYVDSRAGNIPEGGLIFLMDNVPFHHSQVIREFIEETGNTLIFVPPYSPFLNSIENAFSKLKTCVSSRLSRDGRFSTGLSDIISNCARDITIDNCRAYHRNVFSYIPRCLNMETIDV
jgi:transposase